MPKDVSGWASGIGAGSLPWWALTDEQERPTGWREMKTWQWHSRAVVPTLVGFVGRAVALLREMLFGFGRGGDGHAAPSTLPGVRDTSRPDAPVALGAIGRSGTAAAR